MWGGVGVGIGVKLYPRVLFSSFFGSFKASTAYPEKLGFRSVHPKTWFGGGFSSVQLRQDLRGAECKRFRTTTQ